MSLALNALFRKYATTLANLDTQEFQGNEETRNVKKDLQEQFRRSDKSRMDSSATRGMTHSGDNLSQATELRKTLGEGNAKADAANARLLTDIAKKRIDAQSEYDSARAYDPIQLLQKALEG